jgi:hypothetical protein
VVKYDEGTTNGHPVYGKYYGPKPGVGTVSQWYPTGFKILGVYDRTLKLADALYQPITHIKGRTDGRAYSKGQFVTLQVYKGNRVNTGQSSIANGMRVEVWNDYIAIPGAVRWAHATLINGVMELTALECS